MLRQQFPEVTARVAGFLEVKFAAYFKASGWGRLLCTLEYLLKFCSLVEIFNKSEYKINKDTVRMNGSVPLNFIRSSTFLAHVKFQRK